MRIEGTVAVVTGGLTGLGLATATHLAKLGATVAIIGRPREDDRRIVDGIIGDAHFFPADVTDEHALASALDRAAAMGPLRIAIGCAGIGTAGRLLGRSGPLPMARFQSVIDVNLYGSVNLLRLAAERMSGNDPVDGDRGVIVCTSSIAAFDGQDGQAAYAASKAAVVGLTLPAAREFARHAIRVMTVAPGLFDTRMFAGVTSDVRADLEARTPHPSRLGRPEEFAGLIAHIVENGMLNGTTIRIDGAIRMPHR